MSIGRRSFKMAGLLVLLVGVLCACGTGRLQDRHRSGTASVSRGAVARLDQLGAFVLMCGSSDYRTRELWTVQHGLHRLTHGTVGGVSSMGANDAGVVAYAAIETIGVDVHLLTPGRTGVSIVGDDGDLPAVAPDGRIAYIRIDRSRRPSRAAVYVFDGKHNRKLATLPQMAWDLFWHRGRVAAQIGSKRPYLIWDVTHPRQRWARPSRGTWTTEVDGDRETVAALIPAGENRHDLGVATHRQGRFRRVAGRLAPLAWSPDGRFLLAGSLSSTLTSLSVVDVRRRVTTRIGTLACGGVAGAAWLPRGTRLPAIPKR